MRVIFLIGIVQAVFFSLLILNKKGKSLADKILAFWLLVFAVQLVFPFLLYGDNYTTFIDLGGLDVPLIPLHAALLFLYTRALIGKEDRFRIHWLLHGLPSLVVALTFVPYMQLSTEDKILMYENKLELPSYIYIMPVFIFGFILLYVYRSLRFLHLHKTSIRKSFSYEENINLVWLRNLIYTMIGLLVLMIIGVSALKMKGLTLVQSDFIMYCFLVFFVYAIGFWGYKQGQIFVYRDTASQQKAVIEPKKQETADKPEINPSSEDKSFIEALLRYMDSEKPFLNNELNLYDLSAGLHVSSAYLSQMLNTYIGQNFYQFVNAFRVKEVQSRLQDPDAQKFTILTIAFDCGFNSKASFNRIFKEHTGLTPTQFQKNAPLGVNG